MEAASLCPKCGIELQAEPGSRCPLCGTALELRAITDPALAFAPTNPSIPAPARTEDIVVPEDPDSAKTVAGWSIAAAPPSPIAPHPEPTTPFTPMPSLVTAPTMLPPPPFVGGTARAAPGPLPGPPVLARAPTTPPFAPSERSESRGLVEKGPLPDADEPVPASSLEYDRPTGEAPSASPASRSRAPSQSPFAAKAPPPPESSRSSAPPVPDASLSPTRVSFRPSLVPIAEARAEEPAPRSAPPRLEVLPARDIGPEPTAPAARVPPPSRDPEPTLPVAARAVAAPARTFSQSPAPIPAPKPRRARGVFLALLALAGMAGAFVAGRYTTPGAVATPTPATSPVVPSPEEPAATPVESAAPAITEDAASPTPTISP